MRELWRQFKDSPDYKISSMGRVRSFALVKPNSCGAIIHKPKILKLETRPCGKYLRLEVHRKSFYVHNEVYKHFIGEIPKGYVVKPRDGNVYNASVDNLHLVKKNRTIYYTHLLKDKQEATV
jgi:hypothetical protein